MGRSSALVIEEGLDFLILVDYNHNEIGEALGKAQSIWQLMVNLLSKLSQLEYIGERRGKQISSSKIPCIRKINPSSRYAPNSTPLD